MSHKMLRPFIVKVSVLDYFPIDNHPQKTENINYYQKV